MGGRARAWTQVVDHTVSVLPRHAFPLPPYLLPPYQASSFHFHVPELSHLYVVDLMDLPQLCVFRILSVFQNSSQILLLPWVIRMHLISSLFCALNTPEFTYSVVLKNYSVFTCVWSCQPLSLDWKILEYRDWVLFTCGRPTGPSMVSGTR